MRTLLPVSGADTDVHRHYADDWLADGGLRANFVASLDGAITANGLSKGLQTPGDNRVFAALRDLADVVLVGASTAGAENYRLATFTDARLAVRAEYGLAPVLPIVVLSRSLRLDPTTPLLSDPGTIVITTSEADANVRAQLGAEVLECGEHDLDLTLALTSLRERGLTRLLCEGGPRLFTSLADAGLVDELCLSLTALLSGPGAGQLSSGTPWAAARPLHLAGLLEEDDALFARYRRA